MDNILIFIYECMARVYNVLKNPASRRLILFLVSLVAIVVLAIKVNRLKNDVEAYRTSCSALLESNLQYKVNDSLNAIQVGELQLTLSEYKKYRAEDAVLIKQLKADKLTSVTKLTSITRDTIHTELHDTIILGDSAAMSFDYKSPWTDVSGLISNDSIQLNISNREELIVTESKQKKKFWFMKLPGWLFGYKERKLNAVSKNPNTTITDVEWVNFR